ncbi:MAG TPA: hypothetical protein PLJ94_07795 [Methylotenera sp.]|nr:hypothetical protein [Methylotenera sp.]HPH08564.1 hypothetical protein [Methylotenera sp.]HPM48698.1 hypothetical protein [Methylotenera sp.]
MKKQKFNLTDKPFLTIEEAADKLDFKPAQLLEVALFRESQEHRFGKLRVHAIFPSYLTNEAKKSFVSYDQIPFSFSNYLESEDTIDVDDLLKEFEKPDTISDEELKEQIEQSTIEDHELNLEQLKLDRYGDYNPQITITPKDFILLDIGSLIELMNSTTINIQKGYLVGFDNELVELDFSDIEKDTLISRNNLRILSDDLEKLINSEENQTDTETEDKLSGKEKSYLFALIGILIHGNKWSIEDKDLDEKIIKLSELTQYDIGVGALRNHLKHLRRDHNGYRRSDPQPDSEKKTLK